MSFSKKRNNLSIAILLAASITNINAAALVAAPALPPGSELVKIAVGESPPEKERNRRAHHGKSHIKKNKLYDDTLGAEGNNKADKN
jgi:hypothetical protein